MYFDVAKDWTIIRPPSCRNAAMLLAECICLLRSPHFQPASLPPILDMDSPSPDDNVIIINCDEGSRKKSYSWRAGESRLEIYGHAVDSVDNAAGDFLEALGLARAENGGYKLPAGDGGGKYRLARAHAYRQE
jgi:hypothetical protein